MSSIVSPKPRDLLNRVLDEPRLVEAVRALPARALGQLIGQVGLEDLAEIVALTTPEQLVGVLDDDLWQSEQTGDDEAFDDHRFALWLEVLLEQGDAALVDKLVELPEELVTLGLHRQVLVLDMDALAVEMAAMDPDEAESIEKALDGGLCHEIDHHRIVSRRHDGWDAVLAVLLALDERHRPFFESLVERLCAASQRYIQEYDGLCDALDAAEMIVADAAAARDDRRAGAGYVAPSDARSFLALAAQTSLETLADPPRDPVTRAYFRELDRRPSPVGDIEAARPLLPLLERVVASEATPALLAERGVAPGTTAVFLEAMKELAAREPQVHAERTEELVYLVNVLLTAGGRDGRVLLPVEAVELAAEICALGLEHLGSSRGDSASVAVETLTTTTADLLFRVGWRRSFDESR